MFTGLVEAVGVLRRRGGRAGARALVEASLGPLVLGESVSVHGACLTVDRILEGAFEADMSAETLERTTLGELPPGARVHLERAVPLGGRMGGHVVLGHVDGIGRAVRVEQVEGARRLFVRAPRELGRYLAPKGSVAIDGVSLTVNGVADEADGAVFDVMLVPHTLERTVLGGLSPESRVNLEADVLARYVARKLDRDHEEAAARQQGGPAANDERLLAKLREGGFA